VFPVRYELDSYIFLRIKSVFKRHTVCIIIIFNSEENRKLRITPKRIADIFHLLIRFPAGEKNVFLLHKIHTDSAAPLIQRLPWAVFPWVKRTGRKADLHILPRLRIRGYTPTTLPCSPQFLQVCAGTILQIRRRSFPSISLAIHYSLSSNHSALYSSNY
jgi:hypothetical protein